LTVARDAPESEGDYPLSYYTRAQGFELPSVLNIGASYDILFGMGNSGGVELDSGVAEKSTKKAKGSRVTIGGNFTANSFSRDQVGAAVEFSFKDMIMLRGGYKYELGSSSNEAIDEAPLYTGPSAGATVQVPTGKKAKSTIAVDYAYRVSKIFDGTHNIGVRINL